MYQVGKAIVRIHGQVDPEKLHTAVVKFIKKKEGKKQCQILKEKSRN